MKKPPTRQAFAVLRDVDGETKIDLGTVSLSPEAARDKARDIDRLAPACAVGMPVVGIASVEVRVVEY